MASSRNAGLKILPTAVTGMAPITTTSRNRGALRHLTLAQREQFIRLDPTTRSQLDVRQRQLAFESTRLADHRRHLHCRMAAEHVLDDSRIQIVAATDDDVLFASEEPDETIRVHGPEITGVEPGLSPRHALQAQIALGRFAEIAGGHARPGHRQRPLLTNAAFAEIAVVLESQRLDAMKRIEQPDGPDSRPRGAVRIRGQDALELRHAPELLQDDAEPLVEYPREVARHGTATG